MDRSKLSELLDKYKDLALVEYSTLEAKRHKALAKNGFDGGHPDIIKDSLKFYQDFTFSTQKDKIVNVGRQILKRTTNDLQEFFKTAKTQEEINYFMTKLVKAESMVLLKDFNRTELRFNPELMHTIQTEQNNSTNISYDNSNDIYKTKTKFKIIEEKTTALKKKHKKIKDYDSKYKQIFEVILNSNDKEYLADYTFNDFVRIFQIITEIPNGNKIRSIVLKYGTDYDKILSETKEENYDLQSYSTVKRKVGAMKTFFDWCVIKKHIKENFMLDNDIFGNDIVATLTLDTKDRTIFTAYQLNKMLLESDIFKIKDIYHNKPSMFLLPLIALFTGVRLNEIAGITKAEIREENGIYFFEIKDNEYRGLKNKVSTRKIPIHSFLIEELRILDFVKSVKNNNDLLFQDLSNREHPTNGYGAAVSKVFNTVKTQFISEEDLKINLIDFHSLRATNLTRLSRGRVEEALINGLAGHRQKTMSYSTYIACEIPRLKEEVEKLYIEDIIDNLKIVAKRIRDLKLY
ncbi:MAG: site-specific integrase [Campylobacterota bacterium]|nr:site-specific integrase [Campylobacterota bacterium]